MEDRFQVGVITSTHGIKGEVKVFPTTDNVKRFKKNMELILDTGKEESLLTVESVKFFKQFVILKFKGIDNINDIEKYKGKDLLVNREDAVALEENENYVADLIDLKVVTDDGQVLGYLTEVMETGANDVYVVETEDGRELLLPAIRDCILDVDLDEEVMTVHILPGLFD